jgi:hypothetical protein
MSLAYTITGSGAPGTGLRGDNGFRVHGIEWRHREVPALFIGDPGAEIPRMIIGRRSPRVPKLILGVEGPLGGRNCGCSSASGK